MKYFLVYAYLKLPSIFADILAMEFQYEAL